MEKSRKLWKEANVKVKLMKNEVQRQAIII